MCYIKFDRKLENLIDDEKFNDKLDQIENLEKQEPLINIKLNQKTPLRVAHRRSLAVRPREIYSCQLSEFSLLEEKDDEDKNSCTIFFQAKIISQAGTYIKEFVHGDLGQTTPSLRTILAEKLGMSGLYCDIVALDVLKIDFDWPPVID